MKAEEDLADRTVVPASFKALNIANDVRRRIVEKEWQQGALIPAEADLAIEFGVARATVNKALQLLADEGLLERRRRGGTRVVVNPVRKAIFAISIHREMIESAGKLHSHRVISQQVEPVPAEVLARHKLHRDTRMVHLREVHYGDGTPYVYEDRWINPAAVPGLDGADFHHLNANEWLMAHAPYLRAELDFSAANADAQDARMLDTRSGNALLIVTRATWNDAGLVTHVRLAFRPGFVMAAEV